MTELYLDQLTLDKGKSPLCHPAYHVAATIEPPEAMFEGRVQCGTAKTSRASRKDRMRVRGNMEGDVGNCGRLLPLLRAFSKILYIKRQVRTT
jgi:hypothetical protein